jgi:chromosome segregation protein
MRLKKIELSGFKSFAKKTILELPSPISAVVGPNGSGKSNIVEAVQWALGEQSLKDLRGAKSEDFIFNGSASLAKMGKASVVLYFDPEEKSTVLGYDEVIISRRVYRDGANEYLINNSQVRLKDVIELLSKFGLGASSHHIISQGEADRILSASSKEKREMLEDALGLKIYQLKRQEAERKLKKTRENILQVESLQKEIQPHLKFLKKQAEKVEKALNLREKLRDLAREYFTKEGNFLNKEFQRLNDKRSEPLKNLKSTEEKIKDLQLALEKEEKAAAVSSKQRKLEAEIEDLRNKRLALERDLGRCEGMIELHSAREKEVGREMVEKSVIEKFLEKLNSHLKEGFTKGVFEKIEKAVSDFSSEIKIRRQASVTADLWELKKKSEELNSSIEALRRQEADLAAKMSREKSEEEEKEHLRRNSERELYNAEISAGNLRNVFKSFELDEERLKGRREELEREKQSAVHFLSGEIPLPDKSDILAELTSSERDQIKKDIERLKIKLEDSEGVGEDVLKEYQQVKNRDDFFAKELGDLEKAAASLVDLMKELAEKIDHDFQKGVLEINSEFQKFFDLMFGGGNAELKVVKAEKKKPEETPESEEEVEGLPAEAEQSEAEAGIEISVNIPRKRIKSLDMLSGGERALTSIALMFAMTNVNPPPFLVLDETDAALDESNSTKYAKMLKDLSGRTQLIIVTHNRETMKEAGILYGVTMGSAGVSQILSIKFDEAEELASQDKT